MSNFFIDKHNRTVSYLRLSVTDRCNLSCMYCVDKKQYIPHTSILRFEEMERCIAIAINNGISKIRFTGGEPFVRKGFPDFLLRLRKSHPSLDIRVTTNGTFLKPYIKLIKTAQIKVNLSLDTFKPETFKKITHKDIHSLVLENLYSLLDEKISLKINAVAMKGLNSSELKDFIDFAIKYPVDIRFIEFMPMGEDTIWQKELFWSAEDILAEAQNYANLTQSERAPNEENDGPARIYNIENGKGRFGVITPLSSHFCNNCNRLRITSDGKLRTCLFDDNEHNLVEQLRNPAINDAGIAEFIRQATLTKQIGAELLKQRKNAVAQKRMVTIGG